ncbi:MAG: GvpL/GvpF family gas vesicle protein [Pseudomonadota bacterium]
MREVWLYGVAHAANLPTVLPEGIEAVTSAGLTAFFGPVIEKKRFRIERQAAAKALLGFQRQLEALLPLTPFVPGAPDTRFTDKDAIAAFLDGNRETLSSLIERYAGTAQHQVVVRWDLSVMVGRLAATRRADHLPPIKGRLEKAAALKAAMAEWRNALGTALANDLSEAGQAIIELPAEGDDLVLNAVILHDGDSEGAIEAALERFDAEHPDAMSIRMIGPLPACSFATVTVETVTASAIDAARGRLGIDDTADLDDLRTAYRTYMKRNHPDMAGGSAKESAAGVEAYELLKKALLAGPVTGRVADTGDRLLCGVRRETAA